MLSDTSVALSVSLSVSLSLRQIEAYRETLLQTLEVTFCAPMEVFVRRDMRNVRDLKLVRTLALDLALSVFFFPSF